MLVFQRFERLLSEQESIDEPTRLDSKDRAGDRADRYALGRKVRFGIMLH